MFSLKELKNNGKKEISYRISSLGKNGEVKFLIMLKILISKKKR